MTLESALQDFTTALVDKINNQIAKTSFLSNRSDVVIQTPPIWCRAKVAEALLGVKRDLLNKWVCERKVTAKKGDKIVLYKFADIITTIESLPNKDFK